MSFLAHRSNRLSAGFCLLAALMATLCAPHTAATQQPGHKSWGIGFEASGEASSQEVGLPFYPGSRLHKDDPQDSSAANFGFWGGNNGMKFAVAKLESEDALEKVAAFYRTALARYGKVLDCTHASADVRHSDDDSPTALLTCDEKPPQNGSMVFKAGTNQSQHIVAIEVKNGKVLIQLVYIAAWKHGEGK
ncbi:MAG: hypothetical protein WAN35_10180 [Terracidiphilus sp.]